MFAAFSVDPVYNHNHRFIIKYAFLLSDSIPTNLFIHTIVHIHICTFQILEHPNLLTKQDIQQETTKQELVINRSTRGFSALFSCTALRVLLAGWTRCIDGYESAYPLNSRSFPLKALLYQLWKWSTCLTDLAAMFVQLHTCFNQHVLKTTSGYISTFLFTLLSVFIKTAFLFSRLAIANYYSCRTATGLPSFLWTSILSRYSKSNARIERFLPFPRTEILPSCQSTIWWILCVT